MQKLFSILVATTALGWAQVSSPASPAIAQATPAPARAAQQAPPPVLAAPPRGGFNIINTNIELTVYVVSGLAQAQTGAAADLPDDLASTLNQMRGVFAYKSYKLMNAFTLRSRNGGGAEMAGDLPLNNWMYDFKYGNANVFENSPGVVHINRLRLEIARRSNILTRVTTPNGVTPSPLPTAPTSNTVALVATDLDLKEGQKTVVGESAVNGTDALFLVIVPKVVSQ